LENKIGIVFNHACDTNDDYHIVITSMVKNQDWENAMTIDANTATIVETETAKTWTRRYRDRNKNSIWYHFFGINLFDEILSSPSFSHIKIHQGLNEENEYQMLLFVYFGEKSSEQRAAGGLVMVYDASNGCPPCETN
jgi:hypothetical protein